MYALWQSLFSNFSLYIAAIILLITIAAIVFLSIRIPIKKLQNKFSDFLIRMEERERFYANAQKNLQQQSNTLSEQQLTTLKTIISSMQQGMADIRTQITTTLSSNADILGKTVEKLTSHTSTQLQNITKLVEQRLFEGFEKTTNVFTDVVKRLALIDEAQKKLTELSTNVVGLQEILSDKSSRGIFGEIQLEHLIRNVIPKDNYAFQYTLENGKRVDCMLFLPEPTGNIAIDAKFPLESYQKIFTLSASNSERKVAVQQFNSDIRKHIQDISEKYIIEGQTNNGALMFIPAEAIFAEIHAHYPELVAFSHRAKVWMVSPNTMMAVLTTARAVLKDLATKQQVHIIQKHLFALSKNFELFQKRMNNLAKHINQAQNDVEEVQISSQKITSQFNQIEQIELAETESELKD